MTTKKKFSSSGRYFQGYIKCIDAKIEELWNLNPFPLSRPGRQPSIRSDRQHQHTEIVFLPWKTSQLKLLFEQNSNVIKQGNCRSNIIECKMSQ